LKIAFDGSPSLNGNPKSREIIVLSAACPLVVYVCKCSEESEGKYMPTVPEIITESVLEQL
jgi:hypothetical protein